MSKAQTTKVAELYGLPTFQPANWSAVVKEQHCPYLKGKCAKTRKSNKNETIGTCSLYHGRGAKVLMICPARLIDSTQVVFQECRSLLQDEGDEVRIVPEVQIPNGTVDYCLVSLKGGRLIDFVGIELQTLDTTGSIWPDRQQFLEGQGAEKQKGAGINWKMTAKTILLQLHHKIETFENLGKRLVLAIQDELLTGMRKKFNFDHVRAAKPTHSMHFHSYTLRKGKDAFELIPAEKVSTDAHGVAACLGPKTDPKMPLADLSRVITRRLAKSISLGSNDPLPAPPSATTTFDEG